MSQLACSMPHLILTQRPLWQRVLERALDTVEAGITALRCHLERRLVQRVPDVPDGLSAAALRDMGFAAWQVERHELQRTRDVQRWLW